MKCKINVAKNNAKNNLELKLERLKRNREKNKEKQRKSLQLYPYHRGGDKGNKENKNNENNENGTVNFSSVQQNLNSLKSLVAETAHNSVSDTVSKPASVLAPVPVKISKENPDKRFHRLEIWFADLGEPNDKFIEAGWHPVLIISNDTNNELSPIVTVAPISSKTNKLYLPGHVFIDTTDVDSTGVCGNIRGMRIVNYPFRPGSILLEQITVMDKRQLEKYAGKITSPERIKILNRAIGSFLGVN